MVAPARVPTSDHEALAVPFPSGSVSHSRRRSGIRLRRTDVGLLRRVRAGVSRRPPGRREQARRHYAEARRLAELLRQDTWSVALCYIHNEPFPLDAFHATHATKALQHLEKLLGPLTKEEKGVNARASWNPGKLFAAPSSSTVLRGCRSGSTGTTNFPGFPTTCAISGRWTGPRPAGSSTTPAMDDWGCGWSTTEVKNMGQVVEYPLADWSDLDGYRPPDPRNPFYYERLGPLLDEAGDRYVVRHRPFAALLAAAQAARLCRHDGGFLSRARAGPPRAGHDHGVQGPTVRRAAPAVRATGSTACS